MKEFEGPVQGVDAIIEFLMDREAATPDDVRQKLRDLVRPGTSPVVASVQAAELIYARQADLPPALLAIGANLAEMASRHNFHSLGEAGRGLGMAKALRAVDGVSKPIRVPAKPPEPRSDTFFDPDAAAKAAEASEAATRPDAS